MRGWGRIGEREVGRNWRWRKERGWNKGEKGMEGIGGGEGNGEEIKKQRGK